MRHFTVFAAAAFVLLAGIAHADVTPPSWGKTTCPENYTPLFVGTVQANDWEDFRCLPDAPENDFKVTSVYDMACVVCKRN